MRTGPNRPWVRSARNDEKEVSAGHVARSPAFVWLLIFAFSPALVGSAINESAYPIGADDVHPASVAPDFPPELTIVAQITPAPTIHSVVLPIRVLDPLAWAAVDDTSGWAASSVPSTIASWPEGRVRPFFPECGNSVPNAAFFRRVEDRRPDLRSSGLVRVAHIQPVPPTCGGVEMNEGDGR